jgi:hypothetical protein
LFSAFEQYSVPSQSSLLRHGAHDQLVIASEKSAQISKAKAVLDVIFPSSVVWAARWLANGNIGLFSDDKNRYYFFSRIATVIVRRHRDFTEL